ncbi:helix-turn-helix transcriptional regulator [Plantactinospora sp. DSM 117369]
MNDHPPSLPARIRELRTQRKLSQDRLAAAIGVAKSTVQSFESGKLIPQEGTAQRLDEVFGTGSEIQGLAKTAQEDLRPWVEHERRGSVARVGTDADSRRPPDRGIYAAGVRRRAIQHRPA